MLDQLTIMISGYWALTVKWNMDIDETRFLRLRPASPWPDMWLRINFLNQDQCFQHIQQCRNIHMELVYQAILTQLLCAKLCACGAWTYLLFLFVVVRRISPRSSWALTVSLSTRLKYKTKLQFLKWRTAAGSRARDTSRKNKIK